jgi:hypothetical protein
MASKFSLGGLRFPVRRNEDEGSLKRAPKTWLFLAARTSSLDDDWGRGAYCVGRERWEGWSAKRESTPLDASLRDVWVRRMRGRWEPVCCCCRCGSTACCVGKSRSSASRWGWAASWIGVLDILRWAVHEGDIRAILVVWQSGVRVMDDGRSNSSPRHRELMLLYVSNWVYACTRNRK